MKLSDSSLGCCHGNTFVKEHLGRIFNFCLKNSPFLAQNVFISDFFVQIRDQGSEIGPVPNFSQIRQRIRELQFQP